MSADNIRVLRRVRLILCLLIGGLATTAHGAQHVGANALGWSSNAAELSKCLADFDSTTANNYSRVHFPEMDAESLESERFDIDRETGTIIFREQMGPPDNFGGLIFESSEPVFSDAQLCAACRNNAQMQGAQPNLTKVVTAFAPDRSLASYTYGWPEILLSIVGGVITLATFRGEPATKLKLAVAIGLSLFHAAGHAWAAARFYQDIKTAPWIEGESWLLLLASWMRIWLSTLRGRRVQATSVLVVEKGHAVAITTATPTTSRAAARVSQMPLRILCVVGMLLCFATGIGALAINLTAYTHPDLHAWRHAYSLLEVPTQCMTPNMRPPIRGQVPAVLYLPAPYHKLAQVFLLVETIVAWLALPIVVYSFYLSIQAARHGFESRKKTLVISIVLVVGYLVLKSTELAFAIRAAGYNYVVPWSYDCCLVMPSQRFGNFIDKYGALLGVFGRLFAML